ncbi:MAG: 1-acyl-sn-glycerol-3-phosphate acyltransferase [Candidatus Gastranaerophilales bacterium]|nr:1-acyl-sn-glycerol-3-phosphate acyltransferase [Candidatus Gastranaerophilales bacterium]
MKNINYSEKKAKDFNILTRLYQFYSLYVLYFPFFGLPFYKFKVERNKNIPKDKLYILAPNHISYMDVFIVNWAFERPLGYIAKQELFKTDTNFHKWIATNVRRLGAFAVNREKVGLSTIKSVKETFKANYNLCIFPQGGIRKNKVIENISGGFIYFAKTNKIDIVPMGVSGLEQYNWNPFKKQQVNLKIGTPISYELDEKEILKQWCDQVCKLTGYENKNFIEENK